MVTGCPCRSATQRWRPTHSWDNRIWPNDRLSEDLVYEPREWEEFVVDSVCGPPPLVKGWPVRVTWNDIAAFRSDAGLSAVGLFRSAALRPPLRVSEINLKSSKYFWPFVMAYRMPERYWIVAPRECGTAQPSPCAAKLRLSSVRLNRDKGLGKLGAEEDYERVGSSLQASTEPRVETTARRDRATSPSPHHAAALSGLGPRQRSHHLHL
jgi:hypothetical protein